MSRTRTLVALTALAALTAGCGSSGGGASGGGDTIKLGAWYPLSGPQASSGTPQQVGATVFFKKFNADGGVDGKKVKFTTKDNAFDPQQTIQIAREMVSRDKVQAIVATNGTATTEATFPFVLQQNKVPIFGTYGGSEAWYSPPRPGLFGTQTLYENQARSAVEWAVEDGVKNLLVVRDDPEAFATVSKVGQAQAKKLGAKASELVVKIGTTDYAPIVNQVKSKAPDGVLLILPPQEAAAYLNEVALHTWDVLAGLAGTDDPIPLDEEAAEVLLELYTGPLAMMTAWAGKPDELDEVTIVAFENHGLTIAEEIVLVAEPPVAPTAHFTGPVEAAVRLLTGRLRPDTTPEGVGVTGNVTLDDLRRVFPGY